MNIKPRVKKRNYTLTLEQWYTDFIAENGLTEAFEEATKEL